MVTGSVRLLLTWAHQHDELGYESVGAVRAQSAWHATSGPGRVGAD